MVKDKICPKNNKEKKRMTVQIYTAREEDEAEEGKPYEGSQYSSEGEEMGFEDEFQEEEGEVQMHTYRRKEFKEDFKEIDELDEDDQPTEESSDNEDIVENSKSDSEDHEDDGPIQEFPTRESEIEETKESESYKTKNEIIYES